MKIFEKNNMKLAVIFILMFLITFAASCEKAWAKSFSIHLYYDAKTERLSFDPEKEEKVSLRDKFVSYSDFISEEKTGEYVLRLYESDGYGFDLTEFDKKYGSFNVNIPYFSTAKELKIFDKASGAELLQFDLSSFMTCNLNDVCEFEKGEHYYSCLGDCIREKVVFSDQTLNVLEENGGAVVDKKTNELLLRSPEIIENYQKKERQRAVIKFIVLSVIAGAFLATAAIFILKAYRKRS